MRPNHSIPISHLENIFRQYLQELHKNNNFAFSGTDPSGNTNISVAKKHIFIQNALMYGDITTLESVRSYLTSIENDLITENIKIYIFDEDHTDENNWLSVYQVMR